MTGTSHGKQRAEVDTGWSEGKMIIKCPTLPCRKKTINPVFQVGALKERSGFPEGAQHLSFDGSQKLFGRNKFPFPSRTRQVM